MSTDSRLCVFGEVLFDQFPDGNRVLGGAPFNVAWHLQAFGQAPYFISRVGDDPEGREIRAGMRAWGMSEDGLQTDPALPTGRVSVRFESGEPSYDIVHPCAYDRIAPADAMPPCGLLYHGSLALRDPVSQAALATIKEAGADTVFLDVNLREPWWHVPTVLEQVRDAHWVKLNTEELSLLHPDAEPRAFMAVHDLRGLVLTHGGDGAEVLTIDGARVTVAPDGNADVVDTVGAGDAFASVMILGLANGWSLADTAERAQTFASRLVERQGATVADPAFYAPFREAWRV